VSVNGGPEEWFRPEKLGWKNDPAKLKLIATEASGEPEGTGGPDNREGHRREVPAVLPRLVQDPLHPPLLGFRGDVPAVTEPVGLVSVPATGYPHRS